MELEVFFDYLCPFCYKGHKNLLELRDKYPQPDITWRPCEAHPRPEPAVRHSDLAIQGMYFIRDHHCDIWNYHKLIFETVFVTSGNIEDLDTLTDIAGRCNADPDEFCQAVSENRYAGEVEAGNRYAWEEQGLKAVPSYRSDPAFIGSQNGVMVALEELDRFLAKITDSRPL